MLRGPNAVPPPTMYVGPDVDPAVGWPTHVEPRTTPPAIGAGGGYPVAGPVTDPAANALRQEPRSLVIPNQQPGAAEEIGLGYVAIPGRLNGGIGIRVEQQAPEYTINLDISKLEAAGPFDPSTTYIPAWNPGTEPDQVRRIPVSAVPADAPADGQIWGRQDGTWAPLEASMTVDWSNIQNKPSTFPPTLPIPSSGVTGLDAAQMAQDNRLTVVETENTSQDTAIAANVTALAGKEPIIAAGNPAYFWAGDKTWKPVPAAGIAEAPTDGQLYSRKGSNASWVVASAGAVVSDTPPTGMPVSTIWWNSASGGLFIDYQDPNTRQWVMVNAAGMPEANKDGKPYARKDGGWFDLTATLAAKADDTDLANYLALTGGALTGAVSSNSAISSTVNSNGGYAMVANNTNTAGGGVIGYSGSIYGILGYGGYSLYGTGQIYVANNITATGAVICSQGFQNSSVANCIMFWGGANIWTVQSGTHFEFAFSGTTNYRMEATIFRTLQDNNKSLGVGAYRWTTVYAVTGTINTSDENEKQDIRPLNEAELRVARALKPLIVMYRWKDRVEEKSNDARLHTGIIAQRVEEAFAAEGLDARNYGLFCIDPKVIYHPAVRDENGVTLEEEWEEPDGERYGVRYDELAMFILAGL
jgi:Chaperone of endosialidase